MRSASTVAHWSPRSGRIVEGFDADEPYSANGGGGFDSSVLNRPWVSAHNYNHYAYDPRLRLLVSARGYLYDPDRMDWLRIEPYPAPFVFDWAHTVVEASRHGAVVWARRRSPRGEPAEDFGLWLFDREKGWVDLEPRGKLFAPYCDAHGMVYDSKRNRMVISGVGGGYEKLSDGSFLAFDFATRSIQPIVPEGRERLRTRNARELVYVEHADWIILGELYGRDEEGRGKGYTRVYDCAANRAFLLDAGNVPDGHSTGWVYDARRKLVYVFTYRGEVWAMRPDPSSASPVGRAEGPGAAPKASGAQATWIAVTAPAFREAIEPLAEHRRGEGYRVAVVETSEVLLPERIGVGDGTPLKEHLSRLYREAGGACAVLLVGAASALAADEAARTVVPPLRGSVGRMQGEPTDNGYGDPGRDMLPRVAVGRFPARSPDEAAAMVRKTLAFERSPASGPWADRIALIMGNPGGRTPMEQRLGEWLVGNAGTRRFEKIAPRWTVRAIFHSPQSPYCVPDASLREQRLRLLEEGQVFSL